MEETLISFETAVLAKEKGFNIATVYGYDNNGSLKEYFTYASYSPGEPEIRIEDFICKWEYQAPTQGLLQKWLREVHNIYLTVIPVGDSGYELRYWYYSILGVYCKDGQHGINRFQTYEEALEAGLLKALKLVK